MRLYFFLLAWCVAFSASVFAQSPSITFDHVAIEDGLSQSTVFAITQDAQGFMWFGTRDGLNRFDGRRVKVFRNDPADPSTISDNTIYCLMTDSKGRVWVGTRHGLNLYNEKNDNFIRDFSFNRAEISSATCLFEDRSKNIWIGTRGGLKLLLEGDTAKVVYFNHDPSKPSSLMDDNVRSVYQDHEGTIWIGTSLGLSKLIYRSPTDYAFTSFSISGAANGEPQTNWVNTIIGQADGYLLVGTEKNGLLLFDIAKSAFIPTIERRHDVESRTVRCITKDGHNNFWVGTIGGIYILNQQFELIKKLNNIPDNDATISDNSVRAIYFDKAGSCWAGAFRGGVNFYNPTSNHFGEIKFGPEFPDLKFKVAGALTVDKQQNIWIGTEGNGLYYVDRFHKVIKHFGRESSNKNSLSHNNVKCLLLEEGKGIWIGTLKGLNYYNFQQNKFTQYLSNPKDPNSLPDDIIYDITRDSHGDLWIATFRGGLVKFSPPSGRFYKMFAPQSLDSLVYDSEGITRLYTDSNKSLWIGTLGGVNKKGIDETTFTQYTPNATDTVSIKGDYVLSLFEDSDRRLWIGTRGSGLNLLRKDGKTFQNFTVEDGLPGNSVYGILEDNKGYLWLSTDNGLSRLDKKNKVFKNFNEIDGLICKEFNFNSFAKDHLGYLYFGGYNGIVYFHPDSIRENKLPPALRFTELKLFNKAIKPISGSDAILKQSLTATKELEFKHDQNVFSIEFAVLNYVKASKNQFAYKLDGFETQWNIVKEPIATYMNLGPGEYKLLAKGSNNDGVWNDEPLALTITVLPPPWKTWWAYTFYVSLVLTLLYIWYRFKVKQVQLEHAFQIEHLEKQKQDELHHAKLNFFTNIAHEIRTPLTLMIGPVDHIYDRLRQNDGLKKDIGMVKTNTDRLMRLLNQLLDFQKHETGNVSLKVRRNNFVDFIKEIILPFEDFAEARNITLHAIFPEQPVPLWFDHDELSKVFNNLLTNAFKFTPGGGQVWIRIHQEFEDGSDDHYTVKITLEDNGLGIPDHQLEKIFHRFYQAENTGIHETGFGIGLSLAKGIIELHHGQISVESCEATSDQHGYTRFYITLPGGNSHFDREQIYEESAPPAEIDSIEGPSENALAGNNGQHDQYLILVVEDNDDIREYVSNILTQNHYAVISCCNGQEGIQAATEKLPDLILSDVMMGSVNGLDLLTHVKGDVRTSHIPVILLTARVAVNHQVEGLVTGADDYITKPFNVQLLLAKINNHLKIRERLKEKYCRMVTLQPQAEEIEGPDDKFLKHLMEILDKNLLDAEFNVTKLSREIGMSRPVLFRKTKMLTGLSVIDLIRSVRLKKAEMLLKQKKLSISEVAFAVGFNDPKYFSKSFKEQYGKSPSQFMD
jgi:signal transduction histidine kinase/ligand-binding sensor domain-containing protein/AraC-like DNA-binding protein